MNNYFFLNQCYKYKEGKKNRYQKEKHTRKKPPMKQMKIIVKQLAINLNFNYLYNTR